MVKVRAYLLRFTVLSALILVACQTGTPLAFTPLPVTRTPTMTLTLQPSPTNTNLPQPTLAPTEALDCRDDLLFLSDLTISDGTRISPGESFEKRWSVENSGTCSWGPGYLLVRIGQDAFEGPESIDLFPARAGATAVLQLILQAPEIPGEYISRWRAQAPDGSFFGEELYLLVVVSE